VLCATLNEGDGSWAIEIFDVRFKFACSICHRMYLRAARSTARRAVTSCCRHGWHPP
jgi:hypothetical protein